MKIIVGLLLLIASISVGVWVKLHGSFRPGNGPEYNLKQVKLDPASLLRGKTIFCLGSSVTMGLAPTSGVSKDIRPLGLLSLAFCASCPPMTLHFTVN